MSARFTTADGRSGARFRPDSGPVVGSVRYCSGSPDYGEHTRFFIDFSEPVVAESPAASLLHLAAADRALACSAAQEPSPPDGLGEIVLDCDDIGNSDTVVLSWDAGIHSSSGVVLAEMPADAPLPMALSIAHAVRIDDHCGLLDL